MIRQITSKFSIIPAHGNYLRRNHGGFTLMPHNRMNGLDASPFLVEFAKPIMHILSQKLSLLKLIQTVSIECRGFLANTNLDDSG
jgi:hypothetical protein